MTILEIKSGIEHEVIVELVTDEELKRLTKSRYFFNWKELAKYTQLFKLRRKDDKDIKGVMAIIDFPSEYRIEIKLLTVSKENVVLKKEKGKKEKEFEHIAGNLIAFAGRIAVAKYGALACVSLLPKTTIKSHYMREYGMEDGGHHVFLELRSLYNLIQKYNV